jgi:putative serine protease PepD
MRNHPVRLVVITALLAIAATLTALQWNIIPGYRNQNASVKAFSFAQAGPLTLSSEEETNVRVYAQVSPGVVNVTTRVIVEDRFFFRAFMREESGTGSGCVLDKDGHVLTNYHVIENASSLEVSLPDGTKYRAALVGADRQNDLAVLKLENAPAERLYPIPLGASGGLKVGQKVLAIGNPLGLQNTLTVGIISSLGRRIETQGGDLVDNVIQTDAAINPGNSGGPLLNTSGEMIGVNTSIFTIGGGNIGIGFAIPADTIRRVATELIRDGRVRRPWFGIEGYTLNAELSKVLSLPVSEGVLVYRVYSGSSADKADIRGASEVVRWFNNRIGVGGDIIIEIDGKAVKSQEELQLFLEAEKPGETVRVTLYRGKNRIQKNVVLLERTESVNRRRL